MRVRALPVVYACQGCPRHGQAAREVAEGLERSGLAEAVWLGKPGVQPKARYPIIAIDACSDACARKWLAGHGVRVDQHYVLE